MIVKFEFDTAREDFDYCELERHLQAGKMALCLNDILDKLRHFEKWDERENVSKEEIIDAIINIYEQDNIDMESLGY